MSEKITAMQALLRQVPGKVGFFYEDLTTGEQLALNEETPLLAASVIKLPILTEVFRRFDEGTLDPDQPVTIREEDKLPSCGALNYLHAGLQVTLRDLAVLMIILSDNTATNLLIDLLGQDAINRQIRRLGLQNTRLERPLFRPDLAAKGLENRVSAGDMASLLKRLYRGELASPKADREMMTILADQRLNGKLPFYLHSRGIKMAHKTGEDDGITHDVGLILGDRPAVLCFLSNETNVPLAERAMQDIAALAAGIRKEEMA